MFVTKFFGLHSVRRLKAITHPTVSVTFLTENYQTLFTPGTQTSFSTPFLKINVFFSAGPTDFSFDIYTKRIIRQRHLFTKLCSCVMLLYWCGHSCLCGWYHNIA